MKLAIYILLGFLACTGVSQTSNGSLTDTNESLAQKPASYTLTSQYQEVIDAWLRQHPQFRMATDSDCDCSNEIQQMKAGYGGPWKPVPDYHPYAVTGDFNSDGVSDFGVVVIDTSKSTKNFALLIFNGPFGSKPVPAFIESDLDLRYQGLFFGPPGRKPYRLIVGPFESDNTSILIPHGRTYRLQ